MARFILYAHDALGLGRVRRNLALSRQLVELDPCASVLVVTGTDVAAQFDLGDRTDILRLPALAEGSNGAYAAHRLRVAPTAVHGLRGEILTATVRAFRPHVMAVDESPLGPGGELAGALDALHAISGRAVLGLGDVLGDAAEWTPNAVEAVVANYARVLVYGTEGFLDPLATDGLAAIRRLTTYCGYVVNEPPARVTVPWREEDGPVVLATAGGGEEGAALLDAFVRAGAGALWRGVAVAGPMVAPADFARLCALGAQAGVRVVRFSPELAGWFAAADAVVSMGGYNSLSEAVSTGMPVVCVPGAYPGGDQVARARAFADRGLVRLVEPGHLTAGALRDAVGGALADGRDPARADRLDTGGVDRAARELLELAAGARSARAPSPSE